MTITMDQKLQSDTNPVDIPCHVTLEYEMHSEEGSDEASARYSIADIWTIWFQLPSGEKTKSFVVDGLEVKRTVGAFPKSVTLVHGKGDQDPKAFDVVVHVVAEDGSQFTTHASLL